MGDANFSKGGVHARNLRAGAVTLTGGADTSVSFDRSMKDDPEVVATAQSDSNVFVVSKSPNGFTLGSEASGDVEVSFIAFNDDRR